MSKEASRTISLPNEEFIPAIKELIDEGHTATFRVKGYSMRPFLEHGRDNVILRSVRTPKTDVKVGDVLLAEVSPRHYVLHRLILRDGDDLVLKGDGNVMGVEHCRTSDVVGIAIGFYRKGRKKPEYVTSKKWIIYSRLWMKLTPCRRYLLAFHRRIWLKLPFVN